MVHQKNTHKNKNKNTNKKFYQKKNKGKNFFWKDYKNSSTQKNDIQGSTFKGSSQNKWHKNEKTLGGNNYSKKPFFFKNNKNFKKNNWHKNKSKINSVNFKLKHFPDSERTAYNFTKIKKKVKKYDPLFLQQYAKNEQTKACLYVKPPTKHNILYPFSLNLNLVREYIKKR